LIRGRKPGILPEKTESALWRSPDHFEPEIMEARRMSDIVTVKEVKDFLKLSGSTIYKLISEGEIPAFRLGDSWRFDMGQIKAMVENAKKRSKDNFRAS
jgi:excisionase family DNA binding protein